MYFRDKDMLVRKGSRLMGQANRLAEAVPAPGRLEEHSESRRPSRVWQTPQGHLLDR
jgi:hypothetical protein